MKEGRKPNLLDYHKSLSNELEATKDRIRNLVCHDLTDGSFKEAALRSVLRRHLPENLLIARGFIVTGNASSSECDILIIDKNKPTLFKDGDLVIVTPDTVRAIIEVKTELQEGEKKIVEALTKLSAQKRLCEAKTKQRVWAGLFALAAKEGQQENLLRALATVYEQQKVALDCVAFGPNCLTRFHERRLPKAIRMLKKQGDETCDQAWALWDVPGLSASYFLGDILVSAANINRKSGQAIWSPRFRKNNRLTMYLPLGESQPKTIKSA